MSKYRTAYAPEFRQQLIELVHAGRSAMPAWTGHCLSSARSSMNRPARKIPNAGQDNLASGRMSMSCTSTQKPHKSRSFETRKK